MKKQAPKVNIPLLNNRFYSEIPRLPGKRSEINNNYLKQIEKGVQKKEGEKELTLF